VAAKRSENATACPHNFRGESWVRFFWLTPGSKSDLSFEDERERELSRDKKFRNINVSFILCAAEFRKFVRKM